MRKALSITLMLVVALAVPALAKPVDQTGGLQKFMLEDSTPNANLTSNTGVFGAAQIATTYFGGTVWAADSARWEALPDSIWTFDTGVASSFSAYASANPFKAAGLHTLMEGWVGVDNTFSLLPYFRRISGAVGEPACVITGIGSMYAGVFASEANALCYAGGSGYGNSWFVCITHDTNFSHTAGLSVTLSYKYVNDTEPGWDYSYVYVDTSGAGDDVAATFYTGPASGTAALTLLEGTDMRSDSGPFNVKFCIQADGAYSDEDGLYATTCPLVIDDVEIKDGLTVIHTANFETTNDGWVLAPASEGAGGEWSNLVSQSDLPAVLTPCGCDFTKDGKDTVLVFEDLTVGGHGLYQDNVAMSPWIDLLAYGRVGAPQKFFRYDGYFELPLLNYVFVQTVAQWYPEVCANTGKIITSSITSDGFVRYFGGIPTCRQYIPGADSAVYLSFATVISGGAEQLRIGVGEISYCRYYGNCSGVSNSTPWIDNVAFGAAGIPGAPVISARTIDTPQDSFPENGTLRINAAGRIDCNNIKGPSTPEPNSSTGDTLTVNGAAGGAEVYVQFGVDPGPGCAAAVATWLAGNPGLVFQETKGGLNWYAARIDTAEQGGSTGVNKWMTTYFEGAGLVGNDTDRDPNDLDPQGQQTRLVNDIFPDNLFTPGTRINLFYKAKYITGTAWYTTPDTAAGYFAVEVLPSSMDADSTFNCVLFVDHATDRGSAVWIEPALGSVLTGTSANFDGTAWDVYGVEAPSSQQASFGRPLNTEFGATIVQALGYKAIIWNSAALNAFNLVKEDADVLIPWLSLTEPGLGFNNLYLNGDGIAESMTLEAASEPSALRLLNEFCGVRFNCATLRDPSCPSSSGIQSLAACPPLDPVTGSLVAGSLGGGRAVNHLAQGNGCPQLRSFDVLDLFVGGQGAPAGDEEYNDPFKGVIQYASVYNEATGGPDYKTVVDGVSLHYRRDDVGTCEFGTATVGWVEPAIAERLEEVLTWFGYTGAPAPCDDPTAGTSVPVDPRQPSFKTALANFAPNPLLNGAKGTIQFTMARDAKAAVEIFDVNGRLVRTVFDGVAKEGLNVVHWDGTDSGSRSVASGVYFYRLKANDEEYAKKLVVVRNGN
jgi:hypothetical protein